MQAGLSGISMNGSPVIGSGTVRVFDADCHVPPTRFCALAGALPVIPSKGSTVAKEGTFFVIFDTPKR
jgi:hypothetical protein